MASFQDIKEETSFLAKAEVSVIRSRESMRTKKKKI
jgi:hypothetical protein